MTATLVLSNSSLASHSSYRSLTEDDQRRVRDKRTEREARSLALEKAYVHDVYEQISGRREKMSSRKEVKRKSQCISSQRRLKHTIYLHSIFYSYLSCRELY